MHWHRIELQQDGNDIDGDGRGDSDSDDDDDGDATYFFLNWCRAYLFIQNHRPKTFYSISKENNMIFTLVSLSMHTGTRTRTHKRNHRITNKIVQIDT